MHNENSTTMASTQMSLWAELMCRAGGRKLLGAINPTNRTFADLEKSGRVMERMGVNLLGSEDLNTDVVFLFEDCIAVPQSDEFRNGQYFNVIQLCLVVQYCYTDYTEVSPQRLLLNWHGTNPDDHYQDPQCPAYLIDKSEEGDEDILRLPRLYEYLNEGTTLSADQKKRLGQHVTSQVPAGGKAKFRVDGRIIEINKYVPAQYEDLVKAVRSFRP